MKAWPRPCATGHIGPGAPEPHPGLQPQRGIAPTTTDACTVIYMSEAAARIEELAGEFREAQAAFLVARSHLYNGVREVVDAGLSKAETARISGLSRVTIDRVLANTPDDQADR